MQLGDKNLDLQNSQTESGFHNTKIIKLGTCYTSCFPYAFTISCDFSKYDFTYISELDIVCLYHPSYLNSQSKALVYQV